MIWLVILVAFSPIAAFVCDNLAPSLHVATEGNEKQETGREKMEVGKRGICVTRVDRKYNGMGCCGTVTTTNQEVQAENQSSERARYKLVQQGAYNNPGSTSRLATYNQTYVKQRDVPAQLSQPILERRLENSNSIGGMSPTPGDYLQGFGCGLDELN